MSEQTQAWRAWKLDLNTVRSRYGVTGPETSAGSVRDSMSGGLPHPVVIIEHCADASCQGQP